MRLIGIGTDLVSVARMETALQRHGPALARRILHPEEWREFQARPASAAWLARRFAAKEATAKALGVGIGARLGLRDVRVAHDAAGKPLLQLDGVGRRTAQDQGVTQMQISLSDEREFALAFVVLLGEEAPHSTGQPGHVS